MILNYKKCDKSSRNVHEAVNRQSFTAPLKLSTILENSPFAKNDLLRLNL